MGIEALHERLQLVDPLSAAKLHPNDIRRIIRALEVYRATGQPISHLQMQFDEGRRAEQCRVFVLNRDRAELHRRIDDRVAQMLQGGLVDEVRRLRQRERPMSHTAAQAVGYREVGEYLDRKFDAVEMERRLRVRTHQFARRQLTWFRGLSECRWVGLTPESDAAEIAHQIASSPDPNQAANDRAHNGPND
ncbi:MAG: tRNA dimethylallyltransferase [Pirellulaceae bacterium]